MKQGRSERATRTTRGKTFIEIRTSEGPVTVTIDPHHGRGRKYRVIVQGAKSPKISQVKTDTD